MLIRVAESHTPLWSRAAEVVKLRFKKSYEASVDPAPQYFVITQNEQEEILACAGITLAEDRKLFSEQYLPDSVERTLSAKFGKTIDRTLIGECGSLTSLHATAGAILVNMVPMLAWCMGIHYLLVTVTPRVRQMMESCQIEFEPMFEADPGKLDGDAEKWGKYYEQRPVTGVIPVDPRQSRFAAVTLSTLFSQTYLEMPKRAS